MSLKKSRDYLWSLLVFMMLALPANFQSVKMILLLLLVFLSTLLVKCERCEVDKKVCFVFWAWMIYAIYTFSSGFLKDNIGATAFLKINIIYYVILIYIAMVMSGKESYIFTVKAIFYANWFIALYTIYLLLHSLGLLAGLPVIRLGNTAAVGLHEGYTHITNTNLSMTIFTFPFMCLLLSTVFKTGIINKWAYIFNLLFTALAMFLSGRRILWIVLAITMVALVITSKIDIKKKVQYVVICIFLVIGILCVINQFYPISFEGYYERFLEAFNRTDANGQENVRIVQMRELFNAFMNNPIFGAGGGAAIEGYSRSEAYPWIYEASYHVILYNSGIIGVIFYAISIGCIWISILLSKNGYRNSILLAFSMALIANATNPYIASSFDFWTFMFIPILYLNCKRELNTL